MPKAWGWSEDNLSTSVYRSSRNLSSNATDTMAREACLGNYSWSSASNGRLAFTLFTPTANRTVSKVGIFCNTAGTDTGGTSTRKMGLYTFDSATSTFTLVARTANQTGLCTSTGYATNEFSFDTTGGYPASYTLQAGVRYAVGVVMYNNGGTLASISIAGAAFTNSAFPALDPIICQRLNGANDLTASTSSTAAETNYFWSRLS